MTSPQKVPFWILAFAFFPLGLGGVALGSYSLVRGYQSQSWEAVPGVVLSSHLSPRLIGAAQPEVRYSYMYDGKPYVSNRIWLGDVVSSLPLVFPSSARKIVERFPSGTDIEVRVNPKQPTDVALFAGPNRAMRWTAIFMFFLLAGFWSPLRFKAG